MANQNSNTGKQISLNGVPAEQFVSRNWIADRWNITPPTVDKIEALKPLRLTPGTTRYKLSNVLSVEGSVPVG